MGRGDWLNLVDIRSGGGKRRGKLPEEHRGGRSGVGRARGRRSSKPVDAGDDPRKLRGIVLPSHLRHKPRQRRRGAFGCQALRGIEPSRDDLRRVTMQRRKRRIAAPGIGPVAFEERAEDVEARLGRQSTGDERQWQADGYLRFARGKVGKRLHKLRRRRGIGGHDPLGQRRRRRRADDRVAAGEHGEKVAGLEQAERGEDVRGVNLRERRCSLPGRLVEERHRIWIVPLDEESPGRVAVPAVGIPEKLNEGRNRGLREAGRGLSRGCRGAIACMLRHRNKPPQSAGVTAAGEIEVLLDRWGEARRMLDHLALHVDDPQGTVGPVGKLDRAKPNVGRGDQLTFFIDPLGADAGARGKEFFSMNKIRANVTDDEHPGQIADGIAADDRDPGGAGEVASRPPSPLDHPRHDPAGPESRPQHAPRFDGARAVGGGLRPLDGNALLCGRRREEGIARQRAIIDHHPNRMVAVVADVDVAEIIGRAAMLGAAGLGAKIVRTRIEGKIAAIDRDRVADRLSRSPDPPDLTAS